ncbi:MAG: 4'-phosphopantetheinyl transferase superfamily protein [Flavobacteriaceae bacterium]|nr:4'-phosphopantetheinyl transferase superfamily protein [Flavobacteriaceae bacterium]
MPIIKEFRFNKNTTVILWNIEETEEVLLKLVTLTPSENGTFSKRKSLTHRLGFLSSRICLTELGISLEELHFDNNGAPFLENDNFCSLTHTSRYAAAAISERPIGVDVEGHRDKIVKIAPKFMHDEETFVLQKENKTALLTRLWTAKESVYKAFGTPGIEFKNQIRVNAFSMEDEMGFAALVHLDKKHTFTVHFRSIENTEFCIAIKEP